MRSYKQKLVSLVLSAALLAGLMPAAAFAAPAGPQPQTVQAQPVMPAGITPDWPLASGKPLDLPVVQAEPLTPQQLEVPKDLDTLFGYQQLATTAQRNFYLALYTAIRQAESGRAMPFQLDVDLGAPATSNEMYLARELYLKDHPLDSWIVGYCNAYSYGSSAYLQMTGHPAYDKQAFDTQFAKLLHAADGLTTDYEKALALHDALADHVTYDQDAFERQEQDVRHPTFHAYGAIVDQLCVCDGYARAYQALLNAVGIPAFRVLGMQHAWNMVMLDGKYYYTDVTWDDADETFHAYFNLPYNLISRDHFPYTDQGYQLPAQANPDDMSMMYQQMVFTADYAAAEKEMLDKAVSTPARHKQTVELYYTGPDLHKEPETFQYWSQAGGPLRVWEALCGADPWQRYGLLTYNMKRSRVMLFAENPDQTTVSLPATLEVPAAQPGETAWAELPCTIQRSYPGGETLTDRPERMEIKSAQGVEGIRYANGMVRVSNRAAAGVYDLNFFVDGISVSCQLELTRQPARMTSAELTDGVDELPVPRPGQGPSVAKNGFKVTAYDQYGMPMALPAGSVQWSIDPAAGASIDPATGILTLTDQAQPGKLTLTAVVSHQGQTIPLTRSILATQDTSAVAGMKIEGKTFLTIPASGELKTTYTLTATDENGKPVALDPSLLKWALEPAAYGVNLTPVPGKPQVVLTLTRHAENQYPTLLAQYGDQIAELSLMFQRLPSVLSSVRYFENDIYQPVDKSAVALPAFGAVEKVYYAETNDQYGMQMAGQFLWGLTGPGADKIALAPLAASDPAYKEEYLGLRLTFPADAAPGSYQLTLRQDKASQPFALPITVTGAAQPQPDKTGLNARIAQAAEKQAAGYTKASFVALTQALEKARTVSGDPKATQDQITQADAALAEALAQLNPTFTWSGSLSLTDRIGVNFYGDFAPALAKDADVVITVADEAPIRIPVASAPVNKYGYKFTASVSVRQMTDAITVQVMQGDVPVGPATIYSVQDYAKDALKVGNASVKELVRAMLLHGQRMQLYKNYHTERLAGAGLDLSDLDKAADAITPESLAQYALTQTGTAPTGLTLYGVSLDLADRTTLQYYFLAKPGTDASRFIFTANGVPVKAEPSGRYLLACVNGLTARQLDEAVDLAVTDGKNTLHVYYSPLTYARDALKLHTEAEPVARSLVLYNQAANRYAGES